MSTRQCKAWATYNTLCIRMSEGFGRCPTGECYEESRCGECGGTLDANSRCEDCHTQHGPKETPAYRRVVRDAPLVAPREPRLDVCEHGRPDHQAMIRHLAEAMGMDLPAIPATPEQVWEALLCEVERLSSSRPTSADDATPSYSRLSDGSESSR